MQQTSILTKDNKCLSGESLPVWVRVDLQGSWAWWAPCLERWCRGKLECLRYIQPLEKNAQSVEHRILKSKPPQNPFDHVSCPITPANKALAERRWFDVWADCIVEYTVFNPSQELLRVLDCFRLWKVLVNSIAAYRWWEIRNCCVAELWNYKFNVLLLL